MAIEFKCTQCDNVLKVGDEHAGKSARCPSCKTVVSIPAGNTDAGSFAAAEQPAPTENNPFADTSAGAAPFAASENPYATPKSTKLEGRPLADGSMVPTAVGFEDIFSTAWSLFTQNLGLLFGASLLVVGLPQGIGFLIEMLQIAMAEAGVDQGIILLMNGLTQLIGGFLGMFFGIGLTKICLKIVRRQNVEFSELFSGFNKFFPVLFASIAVGIITIIGFLLLIIPGIYASLVLWPFYYLIIDDKASASDSISMAYQIGKLNLLTTFVMGCAAIGLSLVGVLALCIGYFFAYGLIILMMTTAYLKMSGQIR